MRNSSKTPSSTKQYQDLTLASNLKDIGWPIAQKKGVSSCTQYLISDFISYHKLSTSMQYLVIKLDNERFPNNFDEGTQDPHQRRAIVEELDALHKNQM